jgi:hypothetical protein
MTMKEAGYVGTNNVKSWPINIVVLDRGYVYIGRVNIDGDFVQIENAKNIRLWGTSRGFGELANEGPKSSAKLDDVGTVYAPICAVIQLINVDASKWSNI